jgi:hypothetical protein
MAERTFAYRTRHDGRGALNRGGFPRLLESPQSPESDAPDDPAESSMTPDTEHRLWRLLVGGEPQRDEADETGG